MVDMNIEEQVERLNALYEARNSVGVAIYELEQEIAAWMTAEQAEVWEGSGVKLEYRPTVEYDQAQLDALREYLDPAEIDRLLTAPKEAPPRQWNLTKVRPLAKRGGEFRRIIDAAALKVPPRLKVKVDG